MTVVREELPVFNRMVFGIKSQKTYEEWEVTPESLASLTQLFCSL
jgi:hypothetical protein